VKLFQAESFFSDGNVFMKAGKLFMNCL